MKSHERRQADSGGCRCLSRQGDRRARGKDARDSGRDGVCDTCHEISDGYSTVVIVDKARDSADLRMANLMRPGDLAVTQDYGVAAMALGRGCLALHQNGMEYTGENIDRLLFERHLGQKARRAGKRSAAVKKRTAGDDEAFRAALCRLLQQD